MAGRLHAAAGLGRHERRGRSSAHAPWLLLCEETRERGNRVRERGQRGREGKEKAGREAGARRVLLQVVAGYEGVGPVRNSRRIFGFREDPEVGDAGGSGMGQGS